MFRVYLATVCWTNRLTVASDCRSDYSTSSTVDSKHELLRFSPDPDDPDTEWNPSGPGSKENLKRLGEKIDNWDGRRVKPRYSSSTRSPSPVPSDWSDSSVATVKQEEEEDDSVVIVKQEEHDSVAIMKQEEHDIPVSVPGGFFWTSQDREVYEVSFSK